MINQIAIAIIAAVIATPAFFLTLQLLLSLRPISAGDDNKGDVCPEDIAILVPAHNEEANILETLQSLGAQIDRPDKIVVIADNCSDKTENIAAQFGAIVLKRQDSKRRGKGYALAFGIDYLRENPPNLVAIIDADCKLEPGSLRRIVRIALATDRPVQARYLLKNPVNASPFARISEFAFLVKNFARPLGMKRLGLPTHLLGTGMMFHWKTIASAELASNEIVEDMKLGVDLVRSGIFPIYCPDAHVTSQFPDYSGDARIQRRRWEHGHLGLIHSYAPGLLISGLRKLDYHRIGFAIDLMIPPLALFVTLQSLLFVLFFGLASASSVFVSGAIIIAVALLCLAAGLLLVWYRFASHFLPLTTLLRIPLYIAAKAPLYIGFLFNRETRWIRTGRARSGKK